MEKFDFSGWATRNNLRCSDGRTIMRDAFKHNDGQTVPLVWNHQHNDPLNILGHALLENREEGVYAYCSFNDTESGRSAKLLVEHGDIVALSIYANQLKQEGGNVLHGAIKEVSLVVAGANPGAYIESVMVHGEASNEEAYISIVPDAGEDTALTHNNSDDESEEDKADETDAGDASSETEMEVEDAPTEQETETAVVEEENIAHADESKDEEKNDEDGETLAEILGTLTEKQQEAVCAIVGQALISDGEVNEPEEDNKDESEEDKEKVEHSEGGNDTMKNNVFDTNNKQENTLVHADIVESAIADGPRFGKLKDSIIAHAAENNITDIGELFPADKDLNMPPEWLKDDDSWVAKVMGGVHHTPFSRVRALFAQLDEATARARGYIKGNEKHVGMKLAILKRNTKPTTVYIKMAMDRDDLLDISFDALPWIRSEARKQLDMELARAFLLGDGRDPGLDDKIDELSIRPILTDDDMYTIKYTVTDGKDFHNDFNSASENDSEAKGVIRAAIKSRKNYKGSGKPTFFTTEDLVTELLLIEDQNGRRIYESEAALCTALRVKEIVTIPELEQREDVYGIIVNMNDYNVGADKGGAVTTFEDFDIDYNKEKILMETRCSGALVKPYSAIVLKKTSPAG